MSPSPHMGGGGRSRFRIVSYIYIFRTMYKVQNPSNSECYDHCQNPLESYSV
jgi:hypothetical protein